MNQEKKLCKKLIIVHSIKGGCGKTTTSLALAQYFGKVEGKNTVCYIDADIVGPGTQALATMGKSNNQPSFTDYVLLNPFDNPEFFTNPFEDNDLNKFTPFISMANDSSKGEQTKRLFNAMFSSTNSKIVEKAIRATSDIFFAEDIKAKLNVLLDKLFADNNTQTVILDTTPGLQGITRIILEIADEIQNKSNETAEIKRGYKVGTKAIEVIQVLVSTNNYSHLNSLLNYLYDQKPIFSEKSNFKYLILLNQIPTTGFELKKPLKSNLTAKEIKEAKSLNEFLPNIPDKINSQKEREIKANLEFYLKLEDKNYFYSLMDDFHVPVKEFPEIRTVGTKTVVIPEIAEFRRLTAHFGGKGGFSVEKYFSLLCDQVSSGFFTVLGKRIEELVHDTCRNNDGK